MFSKNLCSGSVTFWYGSSTVDQHHWLTYLDLAPDHAFFISDLQHTNKSFSYYGTSLKIKSHKEVKKQLKSRFFLLFLLDDGRIWIRIHSSDPDPDPEHCQKTRWVGFLNLVFCVLTQKICTDCVVGYNCCLHAPRDFKAGRWWHSQI